MTELTTAIFSGLGGMFGWAFADFFAANAMKKSKISEAHASFLLYLIASIFLWGYVVITGEQFELLTLPILMKMLAFAAMNVVIYLLFFKALAIGNLSTVSTIFSTYAVGTTLISILVFNEQTTPWRIVSLGIIFLGVLSVSVQDFRKLKIIKGLPFVLAGAVLMAIFLPLWDSFLSGQNSAIFWAAVVDSLIAFLFWIFIVLTDQKKSLKKGIVSMTFGGAANTLAVVAMTWGFATTTLTSVITVVSSAVPLVSAILGYLFLKERLQKHQYIGIGAIIIGTTLLFGS